MNTREEKLQAFGRLLDILDTLRVKCPWDAKQTNESLRPNSIEEVFELADALAKNDVPNIRKELGDVLLHVVFYSKIASEKEQFDIADVCNSLCDKLIYRHPHIYGNVKADDADQVIRNWEELKLREKGGNKTVLGGVPDALPALIKADRVQEKAANVGFDWEERSQVWEKVKEEVAEVQDEIDKADPEGMKEEFGDLLFSVVNAARLYGVNPENALDHTNRKFIRRFNFLEKTARESGKSLKEMTLAEMDAIWEQAKSLDE